MISSTQTREIIMKILYLFLNNKTLKAQMTNGATKIGLFVAISAPMPATEATSRVSNGVEQKAKISKMKLTNNFKKLKVSMLSMTSPPQSAAMIENKETISRLVSLFVKPLIMIASKTFMQANIKSTPSKTLTTERIGERPPKMSKTIFAVCPTIANSANSHFFIFFLQSTCTKYGTSKQNMHTSMQIANSIVGLNMTPAIM